MSDLRVEVVNIERIEDCPNSDRLSLASIAGWQCVVQKGKYTPNQYVIYFPIDSILPEKLEEFLFPPDSKIKLSKHRIKTIRIRGAISQGLLVAQEELQDGRFIKATYDLGDDLAGLLDITKYEPPEEKTPQQGAKKVSKKRVNPHFHEYTHVQNFKWYPNLFTAEDTVVIHEKIHGTSFRAGYAPFAANTLWKKIKKFFGLTPEYEFVYGSHRVQLQNRARYTGFYDSNVYLKMVEKYRLEALIPQGYIVYGEIYGAGIQKGYPYECGPDEQKLAIFDVMKDGKYLDTYQMNMFCALHNLTTVPLEFFGPYPGADEVKTRWVDGPSKLAVSQKVREGVVIKSIKEQVTYMGRKLLKYKSDEFLLKVEDDTH